MMPIIGIKCDKFVTKSQAPTTPYGVPPLLCYTERETIPRKNIHATMFYKNVGILLGGVILTLKSKVGVEPAYEIPPITYNLFFLIN